MAVRPSSRAGRGAPPTACRTNQHRAARFADQNGRRTRRTSLRRLPRATSVDDPGDRKCNQQREGGRYDGQSRRGATNTCQIERLRRRIAVALSEGSVDILSATRSRSAAMPVVRRQHDQGEEPQQAGARRGWRIRRRGTRSPCVPRLPSAVTQPWGPPWLGRQMPMSIEAESRRARGFRSANRPVLGQCHATLEATSDLLAAAPVSWPSKTSSAPFRRARLVLRQ